MHQAVGADGADAISLLYLLGRVAVDIDGRAVPAVAAEARNVVVVADSKPAREVAHRPVKHALAQLLAVAMMPVTDAGDDGREWDV
jgi:hypothetical protein